MWSGKLEKGGLITIEGNTASSGSVTQGALPGVPVIVEAEPKTAIGISVAPAPSNGWKRIVLRSLVSRNMVVTIKWSTL